MKEIKEQIAKIQETIEALTAQGLEETDRIEQGGVLKSQLDELSKLAEDQDKAYGELVDKYRDAVINAGTSRKIESGAMPEKPDLDQIEAEFREKHPEYIY